MSAAEELSIALLDLTDRGERTPCQGRRRDRWTSADAAERAWAASVCVTLDCPVLEVCGASAVERKESFAVWGGVDRTPPPARPKLTKPTTQPRSRRRKQRRHYREEPTQ